MFLSYRSLESFNKFENDRSQDEDEHRGQDERADRDEHLHRGLGHLLFELGLARCANLNAGIAQGLCHRGAKAQRADDAFNDPLEEGRIVAFCKRAQAFCAC